MRITLNFELQKEFTTFQQFPRPFFFNVEYIKQFLDGSMEMDTRIVKWLCCFIYSLSKFEN